MSYTVVDVHPDTDEWLQERRKSVGASEAGALIGESHFGRTPLGVYLDKIGAGRDTFDPFKSWATHRAEPYMTEAFEQLHPDLGTVSDGFMARHDDHPWLHATFDRILTLPTGERVPLQLKTAHPFSKQDWFDGPLPDYVAQEDVESLVLGSPFAYLFVWFGGTNKSDYELHKCVARPDRQAAISENARELMQSVANRTPPDPTLGDDLAALYPAVKGSGVVADTDTLEAVMALREAAAFRRLEVKEMTAAEDEMKFVIEQFMQDATELVNPYTNNLVHSWRQDKNGNRRHFSPKTEDFK